MSKSVNFEIAKLLKEKGFGLSKDNCIQLPRWYDNKGKYFENEITISKKHTASSNHLGADTIDDFKAHLVFMDNSLDGIYIAPTIEEIVKWLYEKQIDVFINETDRCIPFDNYKFKVFKNKRLKFISRLDYKTPIKAYETAIKYVLKFEL